MTKINDDQLTLSQWISKWVWRRPSKAERRAVRQGIEEMHRFMMKELGEDFKAVRAAGGNPHKLLPHVPLSNDAIDKWGQDRLQQKGEGDDQDPRP